MISSLNLSPCLVQGCALHPTNSTVGLRRQDRNRLVTWNSYGPNPRRSAKSVAYSMTKMSDIYDMFGILHKPCTMFINP